MIGFSQAVDFLWFVGLSLYSMKYSNIRINTRFKPVNLAFEVFEPISNADNTLLPIIFLHGITASKEYWNDIPQKIADATKRTAYTYDARNHGGSGYSDEFSFDLNVEDLFYFMDNKNISKAILIGHSMGGVTATYAAMKKSKRIEKVFVEDMYVKRFPKAYIDAGLPLLCMRKESTKHMPKGLSEIEAMDFSNNFVIDQIPIDSPLQSRLDDIRKSRANFRKKLDGSFDVDYNFNVIARALKDYEALVSEPKGQYDGPAYFIYGPLSMFAVQNEEESIRKHFPNAKLIDVPGAGHNVHTEFPDEFVANILKYI